MLFRFFLSALTLAYLPIHSAHAVRPFITDDARVVGKGLGQIETWLHFEETNLHHWIVPAYGPTDWWELSVGGIHGIVLGDTTESRYSIAGPLVQTKFLLLPAESNSIPGIAVAVGAMLPFGTGQFKLDETSPYGYLAFTENINNDLVLIHANLGFVKSGARNVFVWGIGSQFGLLGKLHGIAEVLSGDPYNEDARGGAIQVGFRNIVTDSLQIDGTYGTGIWGEPRLPWWIASGIRWVFKP